MSHPEPHPVSSPSKAVDVIAVIDREIVRAGGESFSDGRDLIAARAAVAELIAAATALRRTHPTYSIAYGQAEQRLDAALSTIGESQ